MTSAVPRVCEMGAAASLARILMRVAPPCSLPMNHATVGVARFGPKVYDQLSSLCRGLPVGVNILHR